MKKVISKGFTLIELLVVIAIIGILASIVLVSLNSARNKGKDTRAISNVSQARTQIESEATSGGAYQVATANCITGVGASANSTATLNAASNPCATLNADTVSTTGNNIIVRTNAPASSATTFTAYSVYTQLASLNYYCVDSTGKTSNQATAPTTVSCP